MRTVSICVLTYGDYLPLVQRCIESIIRFCPREQYRLLAGANAPSPESRAYLQGLKTAGMVDELIVSEENINKCPMMRRLFERVDTEFIWWFDDDSWMQGPEPFLNWIETARQAPPTTVMWGQVYYTSHENSFNQGQDMAALVRSASWFNGKEPPSWLPGGKGVVDFEGKFSGDGRWFFVTGGSWLIRKRTIDHLDWPDRRLIKAADDMLLTEAIRQQGWEAQDMDLTGLVINAHDRRGDGEGRAAMVRQVRNGLEMLKQSAFQRSACQPSTLKDEPVLVFQIKLSGESPEQLEWCLYHLRQSYPRSVVNVFANADCDPEMEVRASNYQAAIVLNAEEPLRTRAKDAVWWRRFFAEGLKHSPDYLLKLEPCARIWKRLSLPDGAQFFGHLTNQGKPEEHIHGGCQVFGRQFAEAFAASGFGRKEEVNSRRTKSGNGKYPALVPTAGSVFPAMDAEISRIARALGRQWEHHPEFICGASGDGVGNEDGRFAVTHPHRLLPQADASPSVPIEVVLVNQRRPANIQRIVRAFAAQARHCRITLIDASADAQFAVDEATLRLANRRFIFSHDFGGLNRFVLSIGYSAEFTLFQDDVILPGQDAIAHLLSAARSNPEFSALGELGRRVTVSGEGIVAEAVSASEQCEEVDFLLRSYLVRSSNLRHVWSRLFAMHASGEAGEEDILVCNLIQQHTGWPCLITPCRNREQSLAFERLPEPFALRRGKEHLDRQTRYVQFLMKRGWMPMESRRPAPAAASQTILEIS